MRQNRGFTLLELSTVITIIALLLAGSMSMLVADVQSTQYNTTVNTMNTIDQALVNYAVAFGRLPCPSNLTLTASSSYYGMEATNPGTGNCTGGTPAANFFYQANSYLTYETAEGGVPTVSLHLPDSYMYDSWGHRIRYAVDTSLTNINTNISSATCGSTGGTCIGAGANSALPPPLGMNVISDTGVNVYDSSVILSGSNPVSVSSGTPRSSNAAYVLLSHGANGHGGYTASGQTVNAGITSRYEKLNCHCTTSGVAATFYTNDYVQKMPAIGTIGSLITTYDDIVMYKEPWQLRTNSSPATSPGMIYLSDNVNHNLQQYTGNTKSWATPVTNATISALIGGSYSALVIQGITVDPATGALWVADTANSCIWKYYYGTWIKDITSAQCSGNCPSLSPYALSIDNTGYYFWVADYGDKQIMKFSIAVLGSYVAKASHSGALGGPKGVSVDSSGNVWVADTANDQIGIYVGGTGSTWYMFGTSGTPSAALGSFNLPWGIYADSSNNIWVADTSNNRIQKCTYDTSAHTISCTAYGDACQTSSTPACTAAGTIAGYFKTPTAITGDAAGNIWVADSGNGRIQIFKNNVWSIYTSNEYNNVAFPTAPSPGTPTAIWVGR